MSKKVALVVPTIRESCIGDFIDRWDAIGLFDVAYLVVMEDNPTKTFRLESYMNHIGLGPEHYVHLCWEDIEKELGENSWIIPRRSDTVRSFAYWWAWKKKGIHFIATLDDDCYPPTFAEDGIQYESAEQFFDTHIGYMSGRTRWFNTLNDVKPRGVPFANRGKREDIVLNHGLWTNVLDYDAPTQLVDPKKERFSFDNRIVPYGSYFPMCGMNVCWRREYTPWMYHLLMGKEVIQGRRPIEDRLCPTNFDRFGDIWCGVFFKKLADVARVSVSTGLPYIRHERASDVWKNLAKETPGLPVNERLWQYVDNLEIIPDCFWLTDPVELYRMLGTHIYRYDEFPEHAEYFKRLGEAMQIWAGLFV